MCPRSGRARIDLRRRALLAAGVATSVGALAAPRFAPAQPASRPKLVAALVEGMAFTGSSPEVAAGLRKLGWIEGQNVKFERRGVQRPEELPAIAAELVALKPDLIVTFGTAAALATKQATRTIPVIFIVAMDPVESGLVASLARPGGNLTGFYNGQYDGKRLQLIKEIAPRTSLVIYPQQKIDASAADAAQALGMRLRGIDVAGERDLERFFGELRDARADALVIPAYSWLRSSSLARIAAELLKAKIPGLGSDSDFAEVGGLLSFSPKNAALRGVSQIDQILRGVRPADIPVELPTEFDLVINLKTAKALDLTVPRSLLVRAEVIQ